MVRLLFLFILLITAFAHTVTMARQARQGGFPSLSRRKPVFDAADPVRLSSPVKIASTQIGSKDVRSF